MKKTEWFYEPDTKKWWMVTVSTNAKHIPTIKLGDTKRQKSVPVYGRSVNLYGENKKLSTAILALAGCLGVTLAVMVWLLITS
jgi:hypothetical protein